MPDRPLNGVLFVASRLDGGVETDAEVDIAFCDYVDVEFCEV